MAGCFSSTSWGSGGCGCNSTPAPCCALPCPLPESNLTCTYHYAFTSGTFPMVYQGGTSCSWVGAMPSPSGGTAPVTIYRTGACWNYQILNGINGFPAATCPQTNPLAFIPSQSSCVPLQLMFATSSINPFGGNYWIFTATAPDPTPCLCTQMPIRLPARNINAAYHSPTFGSANLTAFYSLSTDGAARWDTGCSLVGGGTSAIRLLVKCGPSCSYIAAFALSGSACPSSSGGYNIAQYNANCATGPGDPDLTGYTMIGGFSNGVTFSSSPFQIVTSNGAPATPTTWTLT